MKTRELTCIVCPMGCQLSVTIDDCGGIEVTGNRCPKGRDYAVAEMTHPMRTLTTTIRTTDGSVVAVRTRTTIPKDLMMKAMSVLNRYRLDHSVTFGDVVVENILDTGVDVIACGIWNAK